MLRNFGSLMYMTYPYFRFNMFLALLATTPACCDDDVMVMA